MDAMDRMDRVDDGTVARTCLRSARGVTKEDTSEGKTGDRTPWRGLMSIDGIMVEDEMK